MYDEFQEHASGIVPEYVRGQCVAALQARDVEGFSLSPSGSAAVGGIPSTQRRTVVGCGAGFALDGGATWERQPRNRPSTFFATDAYEALFAGWLAEMASRMILDVSYEPSSFYHDIRSDVWSFVVTATVSLKILVTE